MPFSEVDRQIEFIGKASWNALSKDLPQNDEASNKQLLLRLTEDIAAKIKGLSRQEKYVVNSMLVEKGGVGIQVSARSLWNKAKDGVSRLEFTNSNYNFLVCVWVISLENDQGEPSS